MVLSGQCNDPGRAWNGKLGGFQISKNAYADVHNWGKYRGDDRRLAQSLAPKSPTTQHQMLRRKISEAHSSGTPIILWGTHHKTGTFLAKDLFGTVCKVMGWCCIFHVTRDPFAHMEKTFHEEERLRIMGHTQWIWHPAELGQDYRFIHFYRDPYNKIISGWHYHEQSSEVWTDKHLPYNDTCGLGTKAVTGAPADALAIHRFCMGAKLCAPCCRREHETSAVRDGRLYAPEVHTIGAAREASTMHREYTYRQSSEYEFVCKHLGRVGKTPLSKALGESNDVEALRTEAALEYYENLRMARIVNSTWHDPKTMNVEVDDFSKNLAHHFEAVMRFIDPRISQTQLEYVLKEVRRFDIGSSESSTYQAVLNSVFSNHFSNLEHERKSSLKEVIREDVVIREQYDKVYDLLAGVLPRPWQRL